MGENVQLVVSTSYFRPLSCLVTYKLLKWPWHIISSKCLPIRFCKLTYFLVISRSIFHSKKCFVLQ